MRCIDSLIAFGESRDGLAELTLLETMEAQSRLVQQQDGVGMSVIRFGEEDNEKRHKPLKPCGALVDLYLDAKLVLDHHLEILAIGQYQHSVRFSASLVGVPIRADFSAEANAGGVELDSALNRAGGGNGRMLLHHPPDQERLHGLRVRGQ